MDIAPAGVTKKRDFDGRARVDHIRGIGWSRSPDTTKNECLEVKYVKQWPTVQACRWERTKGGSHIRSWLLICYLEHSIWAQVLIGLHGMGTIALLYFRRLCTSAITVHWTIPPNGPRNLHTLISFLAGARMSRINECLQDFMNETRFFTFPNPDVNKGNRTDGASEWSTLRLSLSPSWRKFDIGKCREQNRSKRGINAPGGLVV